MIAMLRLAAVIVIVEAIFYALLLVYLRSTKAEALEQDWDRRHPDRPGPSAQRDRFLRSALSRYTRRLRPRLAWLVMVLPMAAIMAIIFYVNYR